MIPKFCHNIDCRYVCTADPEEDCYADANVQCPACNDDVSLRSEMPKFLVKEIIKSWWKKRKNK